MSGPGPAAARDLVDLASRHVAGDIAHPPISSGG
jgi:hypothetical protein